MPGISTSKTSIPFSRGGSQSWASYWASKDINFHTTGRSGLSLVDEFGNNASILPAYLYKPAGTEYFKRATVSDLEIGASDFTIATWVKCENVTKATTIINGKYSGITKVGEYYNYTIAATGYIGFAVRTSTALVTIVSTTNFFADTTTWYFIVTTINQSTGKINLFINNNPAAAEVSFTGNFGTGSTLPFGIGSTGSGQSISKASFSDTYIYDKVLSSTEMTTLYNRGIVSGAKAHYPLMGGGEFTCDASGNGYHLTGVGLSNITNTKFSASGSQYGLNYGFSLYQNGYQEVYVPNTAGGVEIIPTGIRAGYKKVGSTHSGNSSNHNLCNSVIAFAGANFDRSDATIFTEEARKTSTYYDATSATTKKYWHISELNNLKIQAWSNTGYKGLSLVKVSDHSYKERNTLDEILSFDSELTGTDYQKVIVDYCGDYVYSDTYEDDYIYWKYTTDNIIATRDLKVLKWENAATDRFHLSLDGGLTYPYVINSPFNGVVPRMAHIFANGNILIGGEVSIWLSTNNLTSLTQTTVKDIAGNDFTATTDSYYFGNRDNYTFIDGVEIFVWGTYTLSPFTEFININIFYTKDSGVNIKSAYLANTTDPPNLPARHVHGISYRSADESFWVCTGDNNATPGTGNESNILRGVYDWDLDTWSWSKLYGDAGVGNTYKLNTIGFYDNSIIACDDSAGVKRGVWVCPIADLGSSANFVNVYNAYGPSTPGYLANDLVISLIYNAGEGVFLTSLTDVNNLMPSILYGLPSTFLGSDGIFPKNTDGWFLCPIILDGLGENIKANNGTLWIKVK